MNWFLRYFLRGLLFVVPVGATLGVLYWAFVRLDSLVNAKNWLGSPVPGLGIGIMVLLITLVGAVGSSVLTGWMVKLVERTFQRIPLVKLIYGAIRDLLEAFVGDSKKFNAPVLVSLGPEIGGEVLGFITRRELDWLGRHDSCAVYFPQSYNFAGSVVIFPSSRLTPLQVESSEVMQFIVSGGVSGAHPPGARRNPMDSH